MKVTKRQLQHEAKEKGLLVFQAHCKACGEMTEHYTSSCSCNQCRALRKPPKERKKRTLTPREYAQAYYIANRERLNKKKRDEYHRDIELSRLINRLRGQERKIREYLRDCEK